MNRGLTVFINTVEPGSNDFGLCDVSSITSYFLCCQPFEDQNKPELCTKIQVTPRSKYLC